MPYKWYFTLIVTNPAIWLVESKYASHLDTYNLVTSTIMTIQILSPGQLVTKQPHTRVKISQTLQSMGFTVFRILQTLIKLSGFTFRSLYNISLVYTHTIITYSNIMTQHTRALMAITGACSSNTKTKCVYVLKRPSYPINLDTSIVAIDFHNMHGIQ